MRKITLVLLIIAALFAAGIVSPAVSAADTVDGKEIQNGYYVLLGEKELNFTAFAVGGYTDMAWYDGGNPSYQESFSISNPNSVEIPTTLTKLNQRYVPATIGSGSSPSQVNPDIYCIVKNTDNFPFSLTTSDKALVNNAITITFKGKPGATYNVYVKNGQQFGTPTITRDSTKIQEVKYTFTPTEAGTYTIIAECTASTIPDEKGKETTLKIRVDAKTMNVKMSIEIPADAKAGIFATGDIIELSGSIENFKYADPAITNVYLYITGRNLDANGVNLETKQPVVDGQEVTFTPVDEFDSEKGTWEYKRETANGRFEPGTYTIYAVAELSGRPIVGHLTTALDYGLTPGSTELYLSDKSIHVKFAEENGGTFTQGDVMYSYWSARGSPDAG